MVNRALNEHLEEWLQGDIEQNKRKRKLFQEDLEFEEQHSTKWYLGNNVSSKKARVRCKGDIILQDLRKALACFKTRTKRQVLFHEAFIQANLKNIYGDDYEANEIRIKRENQIDNPNQFVLVSCPRRSGKTEAIAMFVAAMLYAYDKLRVMLFSPSKRQSKMLSDLIKSRVNELAREGLSFERGTQDNQEVFSIIRNGSERLVMNLGSNPETSRGVGGDLVIAEEAASLAEEFLLKVIMPLLQLDRTAFIGISTVKESDNYFSKLQSLVNRDGTPFFNTLKFFNVCDECRKKGNTVDCEHHKHLLPHWISGSKIDKVKYLYKQLGATKIMEQEIGGISHSRVTRAFRENLIRQAFDPVYNPPIKRAELEGRPKIVFISLDPTGGSATSSALAMVSCIYDEGRPIICGVENMSLQLEADYVSHIADHFTYIRRLTGFQNAVLALIIENNLRIEATNIIRYLQQKENNFIIIKKDGYDLNTVQVGPSMGVRTSGLVKEQMYKETDMVINLKQLKFYQEIVTIYDKNGTPGPKTTRAVVKELKRQLIDYAVVHKEGKDPDAPIKRSYSGKASGPDDLAVSLQLNILWARRFLTSSYAQEVLGET